MSLTWAYGSTVLPLLSNVIYDAFGGVRGWTWANGTLAVREYDQDGRLTTLDSAGLTTLSYDNADRITGITTDGSAPSWNYGYDVSDRLTSATRSGLNRSYTYDANGNRLTQAGTQSSTYGYSHPLTSNRLASVSGSLNRSYSHDAAGNVTGDGLMSFSYDGAGRMQSAGSTQYLYNGLGQRVTKRYWPGNQYSYLYDEAGHVLEKCEGWIDNRCSDWTTQQIIWLDDIPVATILKTVFYNWEGYIDHTLVERFNVHTDHLNTPRRLTNADTTNALVWRWNGDPFGVGGAEGNLDGDEHEFQFDLRFPGQVYDSETGLHYNYFRDYDPAVGRYVQSDPIGLDGGLNTYLYAAANPISYSDPSGLALVPPGTIEAVEEALTGRPKKVPGRIACNARCPTIPTQCPAPHCPLVYGYGVGSSVTEAKNASRADANSKSPPGCQLKHCTYKCTGPKGEPIYPSR